MQLILATDSQSVSLPASSSIAHTERPLRQHGGPPKTSQIEAMYTRTLTHTSKKNHMKNRFFTRVFNNTSKRQSSAVWRFNSITATPHKLNSTSAEKLPTRQHTTKQWCIFTTLHNYVVEAKNNKIKTNIRKADSTHSLALRPNARVISTLSPIEIIRQFSLIVLWDAAANLCVCVFSMKSMNEMGECSIAISFQIRPAIIPFVYGFFCHSIVYLSLAIVFVSFICGT